MTVRCALAGLVGCIAISGCAAKTIDKSVGGSYERSGAPMGRPGIRPLSPADVGLQPPKSPERVVLNMLLAAKLADVPGLVSAYDPRAVEELGERRLASVYARQRPRLRTAGVELGGAVVTPGRATVIVRFVEPDKIPRLYEFRLEKVASGWLIRRDGLVVDALR